MRFTLLDVILNLLKKMLIKQCLYFLSLSCSPSPLSPLDHLSEAQICQPQD